MRVIFRQSPCIPVENGLIVDGEKLTIREELAKTRFALENAYSGFDNVTDPDLIDCYIYEVNSALKRYRFLLQQASLMQEQEKPDTPKDDFLPEHELVSQLCPIPSSLSVHQN